MQNPYNLTVRVNDTGGNLTIASLRFNITISLCPDLLDGNGTVGDPCNISNCTDLQFMADNLTAVYQLTTDIDCSGTFDWNERIGFLPVGNDTVGGFAGELDGQNNTISYLWINRTNASQIGLFGLLNGVGAKVHDLGCENCNVTGKDYVGIVAGQI